LKITFNLPDLVYSGRRWPRRLRPDVHGSELPVL